MNAHIERRRMIAAGLSVLSLLTLVSCGGDDEKRADVSVPHVFDLEIDPAADVKEVDPDRIDALGADTLRGVLDGDLAWHGISLVEVMRATRRNDPNVQLWIDQLVANTADITAHIGLVYGPIGARAFNQQWAQHTQFLVDYASAVGAADSAMADAARERLDDYTHDAASFFETATAGTLPASLVEQLLSTHVTHMLDMIDADATGDDGAVLDLAVNDNLYLSTISAGLSAGIAKQQPVAFPGSTTSARAEYCSIVTRQTGSYLVGLLLTDDPDNPVVREASDLLEQTTGADTDAVVGFGGHLGSSPESVDEATATAKAALDHAAAFANGSSNPTIAPPPG